MTFTINKGKHRASPLYWLRWFPFLFAPKKIIRTVRFDFNCKYNLNDDDQFDVNKLFGVSFGWVHKESARFGWRFDPKSNLFHLYAYYYIKGIPEFKLIASCVATKKYTCILAIENSYYCFYVLNEKDQQVAVEPIHNFHSRKFAFLLGPFFGGNNPAPHKMTLEINKI